MEDVVSVTEGRNLDEQSSSFNNREPTPSSSLLQFRLSPLCRPQPHEVTSDLIFLLELAANATPTLGHDTIPTLSEVVQLLLCCLCASIPMESVIVLLSD